MMKRAILWLSLALMLCGAAGAAAQGSATIGTDIYLVVEATATPIPTPTPRPTVAPTPTPTPAPTAAPTAASTAASNPTAAPTLKPTPSPTASPREESYVTFLVVDGSGRPVPGAQIYLEYKGMRELYSVTDANGACSLYLFRNAQYGYQVSKTGYRGASGAFVAQEQTQRITVGLARAQKARYALVLQNGQPVQGVSVMVNGSRGSTNAQGLIRVGDMDGEGMVEALTPDGRRVSARVSADSGECVVIDITPRNELAQDGRYAEQFLVYDKRYQPMDYTLTEYGFDETDVPRGEAQTDEEYAAQVQRYLNANPSTLLVEASYPRMDEPLYEQRSCMPSGFLLRAYEQRGFRQLAFTNGRMGMCLPIESLHSGDMAKLYAVLWALTDSQASIEDIVLPKVLEAEDGLANAGLANVTREGFSLAGVHLEAVRDYVFASAAWEGAADVLPDSLYTDTLFELRLTPIRPDALMELVDDGMSASNEGVELVLASAEYLRESLLRRQAAGYLTELECETLMRYLADARLTSAELTRLAWMAKVGSLSGEALEALLGAAENEQLYRATCWLMCRGITLEITELLDGLTWLCNVEARYAELYQREKERALADAMQQGYSEQEALERYGDAIAQQAERQLIQEWGMLVASADGADAHVERAWLQDALPLRGDEFYNLLLQKRFRQLQVLVGQTEARMGETATVLYSFLPAEALVEMEQRHTLVTRADTAALVGLADCEAGE